MDESNVSRVFVNEKGAQYWFPKDEIIDFYRSLPVTDFVDNIYPEVNDKIVIITHDDIYDDETSQIEKSYGVESTYFLLSYKLEKFKNALGDMQFHFDKGHDSLGKQLAQFKENASFTPIANRNHRFWWRSDNLDLAYLSLNGFKVDSSKIGIKPYLPCVEGRILPIWEVPFSVYDFSVVDSLHAGYRIPQKFDLLFEKEITPIVALFHPIPVAKEFNIKFELEEFIKLGKQHNYKFMTISSFFKEILKPYEDKILDRGI
ncbi:MAG: hypothetical protein KAI64_01530 [Thermoplasmata archaeon]|nr:hypothetical protein [Thermoplasmata archaeon]